MMAMSTRNPPSTNPLTGQRRTSHTTGPILNSSISPTKIRPPPIRKPSFIPYGLLHIIIPQPSASDNVAMLIGDAVCPQLGNIYRRVSCLTSAIKLHTSDIFCHISPITTKSTVPQILDNHWYSSYYLSICFSFEIDISSRCSIEWQFEQTIAKSDGFTSCSPSILDSSTL